MKLVWVLVLIFAVAVGVIFLTQVGRQEKAGEPALKRQYEEVIQLPQRPPWWKDRTEYIQWTGSAAQLFDEGKDQLARGELVAAANTFEQVKASGTYARTKLTIWFDWRYRSVGPEAGATRKLGEIAERLGRHDEAKRLEEEALSLERKAREFATDLDRFKVDASWSTLRKEWIGHGDPLFRFMALHAASMGVANNQPGYDEKQILAELERIAKNDPDEQIRQWGKKYIEWLRSLKN